MFLVASVFFRGHFQTNFGRENVVGFARNPLRQYGKGILANPTTKYSNFGFETYLCSLPIGNAYLRLASRSPAACVPFHAPWLPFASPSICLGCHPRLVLSFRVISLVAERRHAEAPDFSLGKRFHFQISRGATAGAILYAFTLGRDERFEPLEGLGTGLGED